MDQFALDYQLVIRADPDGKDNSKSERGEQRSKAYVLSEEGLRAYSMINEWYSLIDLHKAPSARENELYQEWICYSEPRSVRDILERKKTGILFDLLPDGRFKENQWSAASAAASAAEQLKAGGRPYLDQAVLFCERICGMINDPKTGVVFTQHGHDYRPVTFFKSAKSPAESVAIMAAWGMEDPSSYADKEVYYTNWLMNGNSLRGVLATVDWILSHPEYHDLPAPQIPGYLGQQGATYKEKALNWLVKAKGIFDHFERFQPFDEVAGMWVVKRCNKKGEVIEVSLPVNRCMNFTAGYIKTGQLLDRYDSERFSSWYALAQKRTRQAITYFRDSWNYSSLEGRYPTENRFGRLGVWGYSRDGRSSEDFMHLGMDMGPLDTIFEVYPEAFAAGDWEVIANTIFSGNYNYQSRSQFQGLFRGVHAPEQDALYKDGPRFAGMIAPYLSQEAYDMMVNEHQMILENWLEKKYYINRIFTRWNPPLELYRARKARYGSSR